MKTVDQHHFFNAFMRGCAKVPRFYIVERICFYKREQKEKMKIPRKAFYTSQRNNHRRFNFKLAQLQNMFYLMVMAFTKII